MGVENFLDAGTCHITYEDSLLLLNDPEGFPSRVIPHEYGWWINVLLENTFEEEKIRVMLENGYSESFANLMRLAHKHNCCWINLDSDGDYVEGLEINDW